MAHNAGASLQHGIDDDKLAAVREFRSSDRFTDAERVAIELAMAAAAQPNAVSDALFERVRQHWTDAQIVEIVALISLFGFYNRYNDTLATPLEDEPLVLAEAHLAQHGWQVGKHG